MSTRKKKTLSRRGFIKTLAAGAAIPAIVPSSALGAGGAVAPSNRIAMGFIGTGGRMNALFGGFLPQKDVQAIAVADPRDKARLAAAKKTKTPHPRATDARSRGIKFPISKNDFMTKFSVTKNNSWQSVHR